MKKTIIALTLVVAIAIALSITIPTFAAISDPQDTTISGSVEPTIEVTAPGSVSNIALVPGTTVSNVAPGSAASPTDGNVNANINWKVTASASNGGFMVDSSDNPLDTEFEMNVNDKTMAPASTDQIVTGTPGADQALTLDYSQVVLWTDAPADYSIVITFTGATNS